MRILVTGGAGYIGSHTTVELLAAGHDVICLDNFSNSSAESLRRVERIAKRQVTLIEGDIRDAALLDRLFAQHAIDGVVHFAALKAVGESVAKPLAYYDNNVAGTITLLQAMLRANVTRFVFSSSATVYGAPDRNPIREDAPIRAVNPYGASKVMVEQLLADLCASNPAFSAVSLRYFNPIGAHDSGLIGEDPNDIPNNLFPFITQVAIGKREKLSVFGNDWPTVDGTGVRDYIHVVDLALGHLKALEYASRHQGFCPVNLGTGRGTSVLELVNAFVRSTGQQVPYVIAPRRAGDIAACWADATKALELFGWKAERDIERMCADGWRWQSGNPEGYRAITAVESASA
ncbi:MAG TPA: UDP-glucose 4-epimerase GalE [Burkholderiaceae bacterium]|nr:UDP-glucose 4-epimerase GalE [Burkholderiaceae bacterium]